MKSFFKFALNLVSPYKWYAILSVLFNLLSSVFGVFTISMILPFLQVLFQTEKVVYQLMPWAFSTKIVFNNINYYLQLIITTQGSAKALLFVCIGVVVMALLKTSTWYLANYCLTPLRFGIIRDIRNLLFQKILKLPIGYFTETRKGDIMSRVTGDVNEIENSIMSSIEMLFREPITIGISVFALFFISLHLTLFVIVLLPISGLVIGVIGKNLRKMSNKGQAKMGELTSTLDEALSGMRVIKAFNAEKKVQETYERQNNELTHIWKRIMQKRVSASPVSEFLGIFVLVIVLWYGANLVFEDKLGASAVIAYVAIFSQIINPAKNLTQASYNIQKGRASFDRINVVLDADETIYDKPDAKDINSFTSDIEFRNVNFAYENELVLKNINLKIPKGKSIALVGQSGSGKSTLVDLIPRFYDIVDGDILIDGTPIKDVKIKKLRALMGNVNQEAILFNDSIANNISFGNETATIDDISAAAKVANAHDFIMGTEDGYETNIGDRGGKLSGGQRQRLSIARAVLKNPPILILDEATSALDTESEHLVQEALYNLMKNRTSIIIAHRLSTIKHVDEICVLHEGEIVERGTHDELLAKNGFYRKLYDLQMF